MRLKPGVPPWLATRMREYAKAAAIETSKAHQQMLKGSSVPVCAHGYALEPAFGGPFHCPQCVDTGEPPF